jgi:hypothetical protein
MPRPPPLPLAPALPPFGPLPARSRARSRSALPSLSLADEPAPPASHSLSRAPSRWQTGPTSQPLCRLPRVRRTAVPSIVVPSIAVPSPIPSPHRRVRHRPSSPLDRVLAQYRPRREVSSSPLCDINAGAVHLTGARRAPPLPSPRAPIKRSPRAPPSPHRPQPPPSSPRPSSIREAPPSSPSPVSPSPSSPSLSVGPASD